MQYSCVERPVSLLLSSLLPPLLYCFYFHQVIICPYFPGLWSSWYFYTFFDVYYFSSCSFTSPFFIVIFMDGVLKDCMSFFALYSCSKQDHLVLKVQFLLHNVCVYWYFCAQYMITWSWNPVDQLFSRYCCVRTHQNHE